jgi:hypothetical protein
MLYKPEVVDINLEQIRVTRLSVDHGGVAPPLFSKEGGNSSGGTTSPMSGARVPMDSLK